MPTAQALAQSYTWTGAVSSDFEVAGNWSPVRNCSRTSDILIFNSNASNNVTNVGSQTLSKLQINNNNIVTFKAKPGATQTLTILDGPGDDLVIAAGASLVIDSNDALEISLRQGATGKIAGTFTMQNTPMNLGRAHRLMATDANALIFEAGSYFFARHLSGEPFGNSGTPNTTIFQSNATYVARDGASPFGLATPNSKVVFETGSLYKHEQTGTAPKFDGRVYADFELNVTNNLAIIFGTSALNTTRIDNFTISSGNMNVTLASGTTPLPLHIKGNLIVAPGAILNFTPAAVSNTSLISFNGVSPQIIAGNINFGQFANLEINNPAGINLQSPLTVKGNLQFSNGILTTSSGAILSFEDNATVTGASNSSYVDGKVLKTGDDVFTFPTGKAGFYAPIAISAPSFPADQYVAEYFKTDPIQLFGTVALDSLVQISNIEYWDLARTAGYSEVKVTLSYNANRSGFSGNLQDLRIAHFKAGTAWVNEGHTAIGSSPAYSLIATHNAQSSFSPFSFGLVAPNNPLPVALVGFSAQEKENHVELSWRTASEINNDRFEIEKSTDGFHFKKIGEVAGQVNSNSLKRYSFTDKNPSNGFAYYRLKQLDLDGESTYSQIVSVKQEILNLKVYPNPAQDFIMLSISDPSNQEVKILNHLGQVVKTIKMQQGSRELKINISDLPAGSYIIKSNADQPALKFIKADL